MGLTSNIKIPGGALYLIKNAAIFYFSMAFDPGSGRFGRLSRERNFSLRRDK
jgi:hypothetical protein